MARTTNWAHVLVALFIYRSVVSVAAQTVIPGFTTLGDSQRWQTSAFAMPSDWFLQSNYITQNIGAVLGWLGFGNAVLINLGFQTIAFVGLARLILCITPDLRWRLLPLFFLPSFTMWTSVASKEAILVFAVSNLVVYAVALHRERVLPRPSEVLSALLVFVFKVHYMPALLLLIGVAAVGRYVRPAALVALVAGVVSLATLYVFRERISELSFQLLPHFVWGRSTREAFWTSQYDVFARAPYGMWQGFMGPSLTEALEAVNVLHVIAYVEGLVMLAMLLYLLVSNLPKLPIYGFFVSAFTLFWILFPNYPFGILNPGSAVRYRSGFVVLVFAIFAIFLCHRFYIGTPHVAPPKYARGSAPRTLPGGVAALRKT